MTNAREMRSHIRRMTHTFETKLLAISMLKKGSEKEDVADGFGISVQTLNNWLRRFERDGMDGLRRVEGQGRRPDVPLKKFGSCCRILCRRGRLTVKQLISYVRRKSGKMYSESHAKRRMRALGYRWKATRLVYDNASTPEECEAWKRANLPHISRLMNRGYRLVAEDECVFHHQTRPSRSWQGPGSRPVRQYSGRHTRTIMLGGLADDGTHVMIRAKKNNGRAFLRLVKKLHARYGRFVMIMDNYGAHNNLDVRRYVREHRDDIVLKSLPVGAPHLNAIEECWRQMKKDVATIYYETVGDLRRALYAYIRRKRFDLDVFAYLQRTIP